MCHPNVLSVEVRKEHYPTYSCNVINYNYSGAPCLSFSLRPLIIYVTQTHSLYCSGLPIQIV